jgi:radical S-adenosyl methionine domain-containing protein 2
MKSAVRLASSLGTKAHPAAVWRVDDSGHTISYDVRNRPLYPLKLVDDGKYINNIYDCMFKTPVLDIYVTGACNLACPYCFGENDKKSGMPRHAFEQALRFAKFLEATTVEICGGEPLLYKDFKWAVESARREGFRLILRTNGLLIENWREFIADNFDAVGISLDGDFEANDRLRPSKSLFALSPEEKFDRPLAEVFALKALNPNLQIILASVATAENLDGLINLAKIILATRPPFDLWKIHQFVSNNFRSVDAKSQFGLSSKQFLQFEAELEFIASDKIPFSCRKSNAIGNSCIIVGRDGDVLIDAKPFGNILDQSFEDICINLKSGNNELQIKENKLSTYRAAINNLVQT